MTDVITPIYTQSHRDGIEAICPPNARRILDIGGSSGIFANAIKHSLGASAVYVADYSADALDKASGITDGTFLVDLNRRGALTEAITAVDPFDLVFCLCVLEHVYDPWALITELHETLPMGPPLWPLFQTRSICALSQESYLADGIMNTLACSTAPIFVSSLANRRKH